MEEGYYPMKMKRKDLEEVNDDFSDFSLSSPARKIRRLDAELPPIMEEEEKVNPVVFAQSEPPQQGASPIAIDEVIGGVPENAERAIVLFNPANNTPWLRSGSPPSISFNSHFLSGYKNPAVWSNRSNLLRLLQNDAEKQDDRTESLAVVPWVPNHSQSNPVPEAEIRQPEVSDMMDADVTDAITMDIEDVNSQQIPRNEAGPVSINDALNQWQQHCMIPQAPQHNLSTPVTWLG